MSYISPYLTGGILKGNTMTHNIKTCDICDDAPATVHTGGLLFSDYCDSCAADSREYDRKALIRKMGVAKVFNKFWSWNGMQNEPNMMDDGDGNQVSLPSKRKYIDILKKEFLGNPKYDQAVVAKYVAKVEAKFNAL